MTLRAVFVVLFIIGVLAAPVGSFYRWRTRMDPMTLKEAFLKAGMFGIPYFLGPPLFYVGWPCLVAGGLGILIMWAITGTPPFGVH